MSLKPKIEAIIYAAEEPITLDQLCALLKNAVLAELPPEPPSEAAPVVTAADDESAIPGDTPTEQPSDGAGPTEPAPLDDPVALATDNSEPAMADNATELTPEPLVAVPEQSTPDPDVQAASAEVSTATAVAPAKSRRKKLEIPPQVRSPVRAALEELIADYGSPDRGMEIRQVAGGYRMATKPEHHDLVRAFAKSLKPPMRLSLPALETLAAIAYKQPITAPEISEIRGVDSSGVVATLLDRKLITTGGRKAVIGRPILYKTTREFLLRFGLNDMSELPSMEEFEKLALEAGQVDMFEAPEPAEVENGKHTHQTEEAESVDPDPENDAAVAEQDPEQALTDAASSEPEPMAADGADEPTAGKAEPPVQAAEQSLSPEPAMSDEPAPE